MKAGKQIIYTIGHSTRSMTALVEILKKYGVNLLVDVRHYPQFNTEAMKKELPKEGIEYKCIEKLGGFRAGGYTKYQKSKEFARGMDELLKIADNKTAAVMCAEIVWFRCHRRYIADELKRRRIKVLHIMDEERTYEHRITKKRKTKI